MLNIKKDMCHIVGKVLIILALFNASMALFTYFVYNHNPAVFFTFSFVYCMFLAVTGIYCRTFCQHDELESLFNDKD